MSIKFKFIIFLTLSLFCVGCATATYISPITGKELTDYTQYYREWYVHNHPELSDYLRGSIIMGNLWVGMTEEQFLAVKGNRKPDDINRTVTAYGVSEQWIYGGYKYGMYSKSSYYYFDDGVLTLWQE